MSDEDLDPEVLADLQLRKASEYDSTRTRGKGIYDWTKPKLIGAWRCRNPQCNQHVGYTQEDHEYAEVFDGLLAKRGEEPLDRKRIALCLECRVLLQQQLANRNRRKVDELAEVIRRMKNSVNPRNEHALIQQLTRLHHPDVPGLLESLAAKLESGKNKTARAKGKPL